MNNQNDKIQKVFETLEIEGTQDKVCSKCGMVLLDSDKFCSNCGTPCEKVRKCKKCGANISRDSKFCPLCGKKTKSKKKLVIAVSIFTFIALFIVIACIPTSPKTEDTKTESKIGYKEYLKLGDYKNAIKVAGTQSECFGIIVENVVAVQSAVEAESLLDPTSFFLRKAYYRALNGDIRILVLVSNGKNSYGASVIGYSLYFYADDGYWKNFGEVSDLEKEKIYDFDSKKEKETKENNNWIRKEIKKVISSGMEVPKVSIDRINNLFESGKLDDVKLLK